MSNNIEIHYADALANYKHERLLDEYYNYNFLWGGRGSSKTSDMVKILTFECLSESYFRCVVVLKDANKLRDSIYQQFKDFIYDSKLQDFFEFKESTTKIVCANGNLFVFRGGKDAENMKGLADYNYGLFEEVNLITETDYDYIISTIRKRAGAKMKVYHTFNPESKGISYKEHWLYKRHFEGVDNPYCTFTKKVGNEDGETLDYIFIHSKLDDNKYCPTELKILYDSYQFDNVSKYNIWRHGRWSNKDTETLFFQNFNYKKHVKDIEIIPDLPIHISFDQNYLPYSTATVWQIDDSNGKIDIIAIDEICLKPPHNSTEHVCDEILKRYGGIKTFIYGDYSGNSRVQKIAHHSYLNHYDMIKNRLAGQIPGNGVRIKPNPPRAIRRAIGNYLLSDNDYYTLTFSEKCVNLINDFEQGEIDQNNNFKKVKVNGVEIIGHTSDTFFYLLNGTFERQLIKNKNFQGF